MEKADAIQWAIDLADALKKRDDRTQEERNYLHDLELLKQEIERKYKAKAYKKPTA